MKYGERNFRIISANVDDFRNYETIRDFDIGMNKNKADIICIPETHNAKANAMLLKKNIISASQKLKKVKITKKV